MTKPYPMALRLRAVRFVEAGQSRHAVTERLGVSVSCVIKWLQRFSKTGSVVADKAGGYRPAKISGDHRDWVLEQVTCGDVTLHGLADGLATRSLKVDAVTVWNFFRREGKSFKKTVHGAERLRADVARRRYWWKNTRTALMLRASSLLMRLGPRPT